MADPRTVAPGSGPLRPCRGLRLRPRRQPPAVQIEDASGAVSVARTTSNISESPTGSGSYITDSLTAPATAGTYSGHLGHRHRQPVDGRDRGHHRPGISGHDDRHDRGLELRPDQPLHQREGPDPPRRPADTDSNAPLLNDDEITQAIAVEQNFWGAARCCEIISRQFLRKADVRIGRGGTTSGTSENPLRSWPCLNMRDRHE